MRDLYRIILDLYRLIRDLYRFILDLYRFILDLYRLFWIYTGYSGFIPVYTGFIPVYTGLYRFYPRAGVKVSLAVLIRGGLPGRRTSTSQIGILLHVLSRDASILGIVTCAWLLSWLVRDFYRDMCVTSIVTLRNFYRDMCVTSVVTCISCRLRYWVYSADPIRTI